MEEFSDTNINAEDSANAQEMIVDEAEDNANDGLISCSSAGTNMDIVRPVFDSCYPEADMPNETNNHNETRLFYENILKAGKVLPTSLGSNFHTVFSFKKSYKESSNSIIAKRDPSYAIKKSLIACNKTKPNNINIKGTKLFLSKCGPRPNLCTDLCCDLKMNFFEKRAKINYQRSEQLAGPPNKPEDTIDKKISTNKNLNDVMEDFANKLRLAALTENNNVPK